MCLCCNWLHLKNTCKFEGYVITNYIKNSNSVKNFKIKLDGFRKKQLEKEFQDIFRDYQMNYLIEFDLYIDMYMFWAKNDFFKVDNQVEMPKEA